MVRARISLMLAASLAAVLAVACGGGDSSPTSPTPSNPSVTGLTITGLDAIRTGFFATYTAQATLSDGSTQTVTPTWSSSSPDIASVASNGDVNALVNGTTTITATYQGRTGSKAVRAVANFGGTWSGSYRVAKCDQSAAFAGWCSGIGGVGAVLPLALTLAQGGTSRDQVTGTIALGSITGNTSGSVTGDGRLVIGGTFTNAISGTVFVVTIGGWDTRLSGANGMAGGWSQSIRANGFAGNAYQENTLASMAHTSVGSGAAREGSPDSSVQPVTSDYALPWSVFFERMRVPR
jgi:Bacterial Ig-like domain (group 2)